MVGVRRTISKLLNCDVSAFLDFNDVNGLNDLNEQMINVRFINNSDKWLSTLQKIL